MSAHSLICQRVVFTVSKRASWLSQKRTGIQVRMQRRQDAHQRKHLGNRSKPVRKDHRTSEHTDDRTAGSRLRYASSPSLQECNFRGRLPFPSLMIGAMKGRHQRPSLELAPTQAHQATGDRHTGAGLLNAGGLAALPQFLGYQLKNVPCSVIVQFGSCAQQHR